MFYLLVFYFIVKIKYLSFGDKVLVVMFGLVDCHLTAEILKQEAVGDILGLSLLPLQCCILRLFLSPTSCNKILM